jgi:hypothetical protein
LDLEPTYGEESPQVIHIAVLESEGRFAVHDSIYLWTFGGRVICLQEHHEGGSSSMEFDSLATASQWLPQSRRHTLLPASGPLLAGLWAKWTQGEEAGIKPVDQIRGLKPRNSL